MTGSLDGDEGKAVTEAFNYHEGRNATSESHAGGSNPSSKDRSDSHSDNSTTNEDSVGKQDGSNDESSNNSRHIGDGDDGITTMQTTEGGRESDTPGRVT